jgi:hypothetical protein
MSALEGKKNMVLPIDLCPGYNPFEGRWAFCRELPL